MCALCGIFGSEKHWSAGPKKEEASIDSSIRRKDRTERVDAVNQILKYYQINIRDWQGESYIITAATGKMALVDNISELWKVMDKEFGGAFNPLNEDLLAYAKIKR